MNTKTNIAIVTTRNIFSKALKASLNDFARRNMDKYSFQVVPVTEMNKHRYVLIASSNYYFVKSLIVKRLAFSSYRPKAQLQTFVFAQDYKCAPVPVHSYSDLNTIEIDIKEQLAQKQIDEELAELRHEASAYYNTDVVKEHFGSLIYDFSTTVQAMQAELNECDYDLWSQGTLVSVEKMSNFVCMDDDNEYLMRGQATSHPELRISQRYTQTALDTIRNWYQLQWYIKCDIEPDNTRRNPYGFSDITNEELDELHDMGYNDVEVDWCASKPISDTADLFEITFSTARGTYSSEDTYKNPLFHTSCTFID